MISNSRDDGISKGERGRTCVALVGHCGPDSVSLRRAVAGALGREVAVVSADDDQQVAMVIKEGVDLLLVNRVLDWGFKEKQGAALIGRVREKHPKVKCMLVSNYAEAQAAAVANGALMGFGKRDLETPKVAEMLNEAVG